MTTDFPTGMDDFNNPDGDDKMNDPGVIHSLQHININDAVEALERKVGVDNSQEPTSLDYKVRQLENEVETVTVSSIPYGSLTAFDDFLVTGSLLDGATLRSGHSWFINIDTDPENLEVTD